MLKVMYREYSSAMFDCQRVVSGCNLVDKSSKWVIPSISGVEVTPQTLTS